MITSYYLPREVVNRKKIKMVRKYLPTKHSSSNKMQDERQIETVNFRLRHVDRNDVQ